MPEQARDLIAGRYQLAEPLGHGALGRIWRGHDELLDREVALTQVALPPSPGDRAQLAAALTREVRAVARRGTRGIMVHDVAEHDDALWIVTQPGDGEPLSAELGHVAAPRDGGAPEASDRAPQPAPPASPEGRTPPARRLAAALRANPGLTVGLVTGLVMIVALILVVLIFPSHHRPASPPGHPAPAPTATAPR